MEAVIAMLFQNFKWFSFASVVFSAIPEIVYRTLYILTKRNKTIKLNPFNNRY